MSYKRCVVVTGMGVVSPFGEGVDTFWSGLLAAQSRIAPVERLSHGGYRSVLGGQVPPELAAVLCESEGERGGPRPRGRRTGLPVRGHREPHRRGGGLPPRRRLAGRSRH